MIRSSVLAAAVAACCAVSPASPARAAEDAATPSAAEVRMRECLTAAAAAHRLPPAVLVILLKVEGGTLGRVTRNTNDTVDIGPMQVNTIWVPKIAEHWRTTREAAFTALRDNLCANLEGGAWILRQAMDEARGDFWGGVAIYHSHNPVHQRRYLRGVLDASQRLQAMARRGSGQEAVVDVRSGAGPAPAVAAPTSPPPQAQRQVAGR